MINTFLVEMFLTIFDANVPGPMVDFCQIVLGEICPRIFKRIFLGQC